MAAISNKALVQQLKSGDRLGCKHLVEAFQGRLLHEAVKVFHLPTEDAEELVSDVLLAVVKGIHEFHFKRGESDFYVWIVSVFRNKARDLIRKRALTDGILERFEETPPSDEKPSASIEREVARTIVRQYEEAVRQSDGEENSGVAAKLLSIADALEQMESWERVLLRCRALNVSYEEIAHYTGKPISQLKVYHSRVKKKFVKILSDYYPELKHGEE